LVNTSRRPFEKAPGRDATKDRPSGFDIARCYFDQRFVVAEDAERLRMLRRLVKWSNDLTSPQWAQWYSVALGFKPDLILELGRGRGNSTALFTQAAARLGSTRVVSLCMSSDWQDEVAPTLKASVEPSWFGRLDARRADILTTDYAEIVGDARRVLLLWDAHGFDVAEVVLGAILPLLVEHEHLIVMHDISDNRYTTADRSYEWTPFWKGPQWQERTGLWTSRTNIGWMNSIQNQIISLADFATRNELEIGSADHEYWQFFNARPELADDMTRTLGDEFFSTEAHWAFLSLNGKRGPFVFPPNHARPSPRHRADVRIERVEPAGVAVPALPLRITTVARPSLYGAVIYWRMTTQPPTGVPVWLRLTMQVRDECVGVGLLNASGSAFLERRLVRPSAEPDVVFVPLGVGDLGAVVVYTLDRPASSRVEIHDIAVVW
jgi:hypothetical protein